MSDEEVVAHKEDGPTAEASFVCKELPGGVIYWGPENKTPHVPREEELDGEIENLHLTIVESLKVVESEIVTNLIAGGNQIDPKGFCIVAFDAKSINQEEVLNIDVPPIIKSDEPSETAAFELSYYYLKGTDKTITFVGDGLNFALDLTKKRGKDGAEAEVQLLGIENIFYRRNVNVDGKAGSEFDFKADHKLSPKDQLEEKYKAYWKLEEAKVILEQLAQPGQNQYHFRIFGMQGRFSSPQRPAFVIAGGGLLPEDTK